MKSPRLCEYWRYHALRTTDDGLCTTDYRLLTTDNGLQTTDYVLQSTDYVLRTIDYVLRTICYGLRTTYYGPNITNETHIVTPPIEGENRNVGESKQQNKTTSAQIYFSQTNSIF